MFHATLCSRRSLTRPAIWLAAFCAALLLVVQFAPSQLRATDEESAAAEKRLYDSIKHLASDELEGRGVGTKGLDLAADYIAAEFTALGLKTDLFDGSPFQRFQVPTNPELGPEEKNRLVLIGPPDSEGGQPSRIELKLGTDFNTLSVGGSAEFGGELVFAGYGITAEDQKYDDYANIDVKGKIVLLLRKEPQQGDEKSVFAGTKNTQHATFQRKVANAAKQGAAAVLIVNDDFSLQRELQTKEKAWAELVEKLVTTRQEFQAKENPSPVDVIKHYGEIAGLAGQIEEASKQLAGDGMDRVLAFHEAGPNANRTMPVYFCSRKSIDPVVHAALKGKSLTALEEEIDKELVPQTAALEGWRAEGEANVLLKQAEVKNVVGVLEGEGPLADETVIVGAHYDHLGPGGAGSLAPWTRETHNGADDNASGTATMLEIARRFAIQQDKPRRRIVFMAFTAEERGLLGSKHYVREPRFALEKTVAMVNLDMVGRLNDDKLIVYGTGTAEEFDPLIERLNEEYKFKITKHPGGFGPSDHASFFAKKIPVFHFYTGSHKDYHRPSDDYDKINIPGMRRVADMVTEVVQDIVAADKPPTPKQGK